MNERTFTDNLVSFHPGCSQAVMGGREAGRGTQLKEGGGRGVICHPTPASRGIKNHSSRIRSQLFFMRPPYLFLWGSGEGHTAYRDLSSLTGD